MHRFALYHHVGSGNKGCEALVQSTSALLHNRFDDAEICLFSQRPQEDLQSAYPFVSKVLPAETDAALTVQDRLRLKLLQYRSDYSADLYYYARRIPETAAQADSVFLSVGGDTYCYGENRFMSAFNAKLKKHGVRTVLWGCSLDESSFSPHNAADLRTYDAIFARESGTLALLHEKGFRKNVFLHPDPAFTLEPEFLPLPDGFREGNTIGINASPLVFRYEQNDQKGVGKRSYERLIEWILHETDQSVLLLPHVFWDFSDDRTVLRELAKPYLDTGRVVLLDRAYSARQLKGFIARCRAFIGARTHSTIAAYSTLVPTLVLGYSVKSVNIAIDLFGTTDGFVVPIDMLRDENGLCEAFAAMFRREDAHRIRLSECVPAYVERARQSADTLANFLETI